MKCNLCKKETSSLFDEVFILSFCLNDSKRKLFILAAQNSAMRKLFVSLILITAFYACKKPQGFDYRDIKNIKIEKLGYNQSMVSMELVYFNPNNFGVDLKHVDCDIYIDNNFLGKYTLDTMMHIDKKAEFVLPSRMNVDMARVYKNALNVLFSKEVLVTAKGNTKVGKAGIYINVPFNYEGRHKVALFN